MGKTWWLDNTAGNDGYSGLSYTNAFKTWIKLADTFELYGKPGDIIKVCYTGQNYVFVSSRLLDTVGTQGYGWGNGEFVVLEGYDPNGNNNVPTIEGPTDDTSGYPVYFGTYANYWIIKDLKFYFPTTNTATCAGIMFSSLLLDGDTRFKVQRCWFEGQAHTLISDQATGAYVYGGSKIYVDFSACFFLNLKFPVRTNNTLLKATGLKLEKCIIYNENYGPIFNLYLNESGEYLDFTMKNCTQIITDGTGVYNQTVSWLSGDLTNTNENKLYFKNNIIYNNIGFRANTTSGYGVANALDFTDCVGYNSMHVPLNSKMYYDEADVFETVGYGGPGDIYLGTNYPNLSDLTTIFVGTGDFTYFWEDSGWMYIPDLRPVVPEMTGTFEDPINGIRGALPTGTYKDSSAVTNSYLNLSPYWHPNIFSGTKYIVPIDSSANPVFSCYTATTETYSGFGSHGGYSDLTNLITQLTIKTATIKVTSNVVGLIENSNLGQIDILAKTQVRQIGPYSSDSTWSDWEVGPRNQSLTKGLFPGTYDIYIRSTDSETGQATNWEYKTSYTV